MKNKVLLEEIFRIQSLMGKTPINEQWTAIAKLMTNLGDDFAELTTKYADDFVKLANAATDEESIKILSKLANSERKFADEIIPHVMNALPDDVSKEISSIIQGAQEQISKGVPRETVDKLVEKRLSAIKTQFDGVKDIIKKNVDDAIDGYKPPKPAPKPVDPNVKDLELTERIKKIFEKWEEIVPGGLTLKDRALLTKNFPWRSFRAKMNYIVNNLFNQRKALEQKSLEKIASLIKKQQSLQTKGEESELIYKAIDAELEALRKNSDFQKKILYDTLSQEIDKTLGAGKGYKFVEKLKANDALAEDAQSYWRYLMDDTYIGKMRKLPRGKDGKVDWTDWIRNAGERALSILSTGNPRKISEIFKEFYKGKGVVGGSLYYLAWMKFIQITVFPAFLGFVDMLYYGFKAEGGAEDFGGWWNIYGNTVYQRFLDGFFKPRQIEFDKVAKEFITNDLEWSAISTINPFQWFWDDISRGLDWHVGGGTQKFLERLYNKGEKLVSDVENGLNAAIGYENKKDSFIDFGVTAGYSVEELDKFEYDENTQTGTTSDGFKFKLTEDPTTKLKTFKRVN
jgi:hypothetical protein